MAFVGDIGIAILSVIVNQLPFSNFHNTFTDWRQNKPIPIQTYVLRQIPLLKFFHLQTCSQDFVNFIHYVRDINVPDTIFYHACRDLFLNNRIVESLNILQTLDIEGHLLARFCKNIFHIVYNVDNVNQSVQNIASMLECSYTKHDIIHWVSLLKKFKFSLGDNVLLRHNRVQIVCDGFKHVPLEHFYPHGWPLHVEDMERFSCKICKVAIIICDFTNSYH